MFEQCASKKLLKVGVEENESIIKAAHDMGVYAICIDRDADKFNCEAVTLADEIWRMDYSDIPAVVEKCRQENVSGVMTGYSEFKVLYAVQISEALGVPFYATAEQIDITRNKRKFKDLCIKFGVPIARDYCFAKPLTEDEKDAVRYPVIVKPTDYAGCKGITVCYDREQLNEAIEYALQFSRSQTIICEDYIVGTELMAIYTLKDGEISLSSLSEKYISRDHERISGLCDAVVAPSKYLDKYLDTTDESIQRLLSLFMSNGSLVSMLAAVGVPMAVEIGINPMPIAMACVFGASLAMATPAATTSVTMVQVAGYRFKDYFRIGGLTGVIGLITAWVAIVVFYGLI